MGWGERWGYGGRGHWGGCGMRDGVVGWGGGREVIDEEGSLPYGSLTFAL